MSRCKLEGKSDFYIYRGDITFTFNAVNSPLNALLLTSKLKIETCKTTHNEVKDWDNFYSGDQETGGEYSELQGVTVANTSPLIKRLTHS